MWSCTSISIHLPDIVHKKHNVLSDERQIVGGVNVDFGLIMWKSTLNKDVAHFYESL